MAQVYQHRRNDTNEIFYIGIGTGESRKYSDHHRNSHWRSIVKKVGFTAEVVLDNLCWEQCKQIEILLISRYGRSDMGEGNLVNQTDGGDGNTNWSDEARTKQSIIMQGHKRCVGRILSKETKQKISSAAIGRKASPETKLKMSATRTGMCASVETKLKMSLSSKGNPQTEEHRKNRIASYLETIHKRNIK